MIIYRAMSKYMRCMSDGEKCGNSFRKYKMINRVYLRNIQNNKKTTRKYTKYYICILYNIL